jgi:hypothetical protein
MDAPHWQRGGNDDSPVGNQDRLVGAYFTSDYVDNINVLYRGRTWGCWLRRNLSKSTAKSGDKAHQTSRHFDTVPFSPYEASRRDFELTKASSEMRSEPADRPL